MSLDLTLVTASPPTQRELVGAVERVARSGVLGEHRIDGDIDLVGDGGEAYAVCALTLRDTAPLVLTVSRPSPSEPELAPELTSHVGVRPATDDRGRLWLTELRVPFPGDDETLRRHVALAKAVVAPLAVRHRGYLVSTSGGSPVVLEIDEVPSPPSTPVTTGQTTVAPGVVVHGAGGGAHAAAPKMDSWLDLRGDDARPHAGLAMSAFFSGPVGDAAGWAETTTRLALLTQDATNLRPTLIGEGRTWARLRLSQVPERWPQHQELACRNGFRWSIDPAVFAHQSLTAAIGTGMIGDEITLADGEALLAGAVAAESYGLSYAAIDLARPLVGPIVPDGPRLEGDTTIYRANARMLGERLPGLAWGQVLGPPWTTLFGAGAIAALPAYRVAQVGPESWLIQLTEHLGDVLSSPERVERMRTACLEQLGADAFFSRPEPPGGYRSAQVPTLGAAYPDDPRVRPTVT